MYTKADAMDWNGRKLEGVVQVLEALEAPLVEQSLSPTLLELQQILESIRKVLQVTMWLKMIFFLVSPRLAWAVCAS